MTEGRAAARAPGRAEPPAIVWSWPDAARGLVYALPAIAVTSVNPAAGVPLALGVLPSAIMPFPGTARSRPLLLIVGALTGVSLFTGAALTHLPTLVTAVTLVAVVAAAAWATTRVAAAQLLLVLAAPLVAVGLSYDDWASALRLLLLMVLGAVYAWAVSMLWKPRPPQPRPQRPVPSAPAMLGYGFCLGTAAAVSYLVAIGLDLDHPGWAPAACLLVARPDPDLLRARGAGRVLSVIVGAAAAVLTLAADAANGLLAVLTGVVISAAAATHASRWYITSAFTTYLVFLLLLGDHPNQAGQKFTERVAETVLGVTLAVLSEPARRPWFRISRASAEAAH
ncbi:FUSC family protein [Krasilnikovia sp. MM14-A1259]|uniref:FUSC family protein n=1 Tax=Krasilnikovia sp. MM14-A1259 TaxID=3373539 RepID=UPI00399D2CDE